MPGLVLVSISSIFSQTLDDVTALITDLDGEHIPVSLLIAPHIDKKWHLAKDAKTREWFRAQDEAGRPLILNGFDQPAQGRRAEFATLGEHEARLRLRGATRQMASLGFEPRIFAPPRWRLSEGTLAVVPEFGFELVASTRGLHVVGSGEFHQCRNLSFGEGFGAARWWRSAIIRAAERGAEKGNTIRLSVSGRELADNKVRRDFLRAAAGALSTGARPTDYEAFLPSSRASVDA
ncbi:hypothetical protein CAPI_07925 [Corynebacterium capitovis DSM 44611]|uniref:DUF2334 domain-containing protein n=1 Tax=Corynebacterium capitovis TaxID=131081 RepID=UPI00035FE26C|nr:DUF2334 domain-containing protein [Corynebacterium capitovis]WKD58113.1 hypothetical protein CAPI_07925 [Corynebacterium capitovis DSM 44611]